MPILSGQPILASDIALFRGSQSGTVSVSFSAQQSKTTAVTFPNAFAAVPTVVCQVVSGAGAAVGATTLVSVGPSTTGFSVLVQLTASQTMTIAVHWHAMST